MISVVQLEEIKHLFNGEISQSENIGSYTRLLLLPKTKEIAKIFCNNQQLREQAFVNLKLIKQLLDPQINREVVLPTALISSNGKIVGYLMPFVEGETLHDIIHNVSVSKEQIFFYLDELMKAIQKIPMGICVGDLHTGNILVTEDKQIHLIDVDGFSVDKGFHMKSPVHYDELLVRNIPFEKYFRMNCSALISRDSDIYCVIKIFFEVLLDGYNPYLFARQRMKLFFEYLRIKGIPSNVVCMFEQITSKEPNFIVAEAFRSFARVCTTISYDDFVSRMGLISQERLVQSYIDQFIKQGAK